MDQLDPRMAYVNPLDQMVYDPGNCSFWVPTYYWIDPECKTPRQKDDRFREQRPEIPGDEWTRLFYQAKKRFQDYAASLDLETAHVSFYRELVKSEEGDDHSDDAHFWYDPNGHGPAVQNLELRKLHAGISDDAWQQLFKAAAKRSHDFPAPPDRRASLLI
jgi:hypothetical protein